MTLSLAHGWSFSSISSLYSETSGRCFDLRILPSLHGFGCSVERSTAASFRLWPMTSCNSTSSVETPSFPSSTSKPQDNNSNESLSARERRKLRNERREAAKAAQEKPWREMVEDKLLEKKKKIRSWQEDADINRCISKGMSWWMIQATRKFEFQVADQLLITFAERFPGKEFEVLVPTVPVKSKLKNGTVSEARKKLYQGIVLIRCILDFNVYDLVKRTPQVYDFYGNFAGLSSQPIIMPAPVSNVVMETMFNLIQKEEEEYEQLKEQCRTELEEQRRENRRRNEDEKKMQSDKKLLQSKAFVLEEGATVRILSGPFVAFTGIVMELLPELNKVKAVVNLFGNETEILLDVEQVAVEASAPYD